MSSDIPRILGLAYSGSYSVYGSGDEQSSLAELVVAPWFRASHDGAECASGDCGMVRN